MAISSRASEEFSDLNGIEMPESTEQGLSNGIA